MVHENESKAFENENRAVLITSTSTSISRAAALHLDRLDFRVFTSVRRAIDGDNLRKEASERLSPSLMDVTDEAAIARANASRPGHQGCMVQIFYP
jgi:NAD(P)-dependent dehydrogenase (short-subunit alcohol dehydrogenase family)